MTISHITKKLSVVIAAAVILLFPLAVQAQSQILADPSDSFVVNGPLPNSTVSGTVITSFRVYDNNQANVPYELTLRDSQTCNNLVGTISVGNKPSSASTDSTVSWPSAGPLNDVASVPDGKYCMQLCVSLQNGSNPYSACNLRIITIRNTNVPPQIVSSPPADRTITTDESWQYQVQATDANGDSLSYSLLNNPGFLSINSSTGLISTNSNAKTPATYDVTVVVQDAFGGTASQQFQLSVVSPSTNPTPTPNPNPNPTPTPTTTNKPGSVTITFPVANSELKGATNQVSWTATDPDGIKDVKLAYSTDKSNWQAIATVAGDKTNFVWDVSKLTDGSYYLQVTITDNLDATTTATSEKFTVANTTAPIPSTATKPLIISVKPEDATNVTDTKPEISGQFTPPANSAIDPATFLLKLDQTDISTTCTVTASGFKCTPASDLALGVHNVHAEVKSTDGQTAIREWAFTIVAKPTDTTTSPAGSQISSQTVIIVLVACCLLALLVLIPWLLFILWRRRNQAKEDNFAEPQPVNPSEFTNYGDYLSASAQPAPLPEITTNYYTPVTAAPLAPPTVEVAAAPVVAPLETAAQPILPSSSNVENSYVTSPDFMSYYNPPAETTGIENVDANVPDWLKSPDVAAAAPAPVVLAQPVAPAPVAQPTPVAEAIPADAYVAPLAPAPETIPLETVDAAPAEYSDFSTALPADTAPVDTGSFSAEPISTEVAASPASEAVNPATPTDNTGSYGYGRQVDNF